MPPKTSKPPARLNQEPESCIWAREKAGYSTMTAAAKAAGFSLQLLNDIEKGRRSATPEKLKKLAEIYNCPLAMLERKRWVA